MRRFATALVAASVMLAPASALAQSSTCQAYNPQLCDASSGTPSAATGEVTSTGTLPFTGLDAGLLVLAGGVLVVVGSVVRTSTRRLS